MTMLRTSGQVDAHGRLRLEIPTKLPQGQVDVVVVIESQHNGAAGYDFKDLAGKLTWRGDALSEQRSLRNEW